LIAKAETRGGDFVALFQSGRPEACLNCGSAFVRKETVEAIFVPMPLCGGSMRKSIAA
jgi:hypothetical protein